MTQIGFIDSYIAANVNVGIGFFYTVCIALSILILFVNRLNVFIGKKSPVGRSLISLIFPLPINISLFCLAGYLGVLAAGKYISATDVFWGSITTDVVIILSLLYLCFFVEKV